MLIIKLTPFDTAIYQLPESMRIHAIVYSLFCATFGLHGIAVLRQFSATWTRKRTEHQVNSVSDIYTPASDCYQQKYNNFFFFFFSFFFVVLYLLMCVFAYFDATIKLVK